MADFLANVAIRLDDITLSGVTDIEVKIRPAIPENICSWQVFNDDRDLLKFLHCIDEYENQEIDFHAFVETIDGKETLVGKEIIQLKTNKIPRGLVALERVFDSRDKMVTRTSPTNKEDLEEINLGTSQAPQKVYIGKQLKPHIRSMLIALLKKYKHVFA
ncbi:MAG TPA: hypothetical protein VFV08_01115 [Puia sp.]|nr:hypothetical protein [Puia sp.]